MENYRPKLLEKLVEQWVQGYSELNGDSRIYLMQNVLPVVVPAVEQLLQKLDRSQIHITDSNATKFNPIVYLAQALFRITTKDTDDGENDNEIYESIWTQQAVRADEKLRAYLGELENNRKRIEIEALKIKEAEKHKIRVESPEPVVITSSVEETKQLNDFYVITEPQIENEQKVPEEVENKVDEQILSTSGHLSKELQSSISLSSLNLTDLPSDNLRTAIRAALADGAKFEFSDKEASKNKLNELAVSIFELVARQKNSGSMGLSSKKLNELIDVAIKEIDFVDQSNTIQAFLHLLKLPIQARSLLTRRIGREEWLLHVQSCVETPNVDDAIIYQALTVLNICAHHATQKTLSPVHFRIPTASIISELSKFSCDPRLTTQEFCQEAVHSISKSLEDRHPVFSVYISLLETENGNRHLNFVACSPKDEPAVLDRKLSEKDAPVSFGSIRLNKTKIVENIREYPKINVFGDELRQKDGQDPRLYNGAFVTIPLIGQDGKVIGTLGVDNLMMIGPQQKIKQFDEVDIKYLEEISHNLGGFIETSLVRANLVRLAVSSCRWINQTLGHEAHLKLITEAKNGDTTYWDADKLLQNDSEEMESPTAENEEDAEVDEKDEENSVAESSEAEEIRPKTLNMKKLCVEQNDNVPQIKTQLDPANKSPNTVVLCDRNSKPTALIFVNAKEEKKKEVKSALEEDVKIFSSILAKARDSCVAGAGNSASGDVDLDMMFPLLMFDAVKEKLSEIDSRALAELKSYKTPPKTIHLVIKCVLYLFGHKPSLVKQWQDTVKLLNPDLIKAMKAYDPMKVQKKLYFKRIKRVVKKLPTVDSIRQFGSKPAENMFQWLHLCIILRQYGVMQRKQEKERAAAVQQLGLSIVQEENETTTETLREVMTNTITRPLAAMPNSKPVVERKDDPMLPEPTIQ